MIGFYTEELALHDPIGYVLRSSPTKRGRSYEAVPGTGSRFSLLCPEACPVQHRQGVAGGTQAVRSAWAAVIEFEVRLQGASGIVAPDVLIAFRAGVKVPGRAPIGLRKHLEPDVPATTELNTHCLTRTRVGASCASSSGSPGARAEPEARGTSYRHP